RADPRVDKDEAPPSRRRHAGHLRTRTRDDDRPRAQEEPLRPRAPRLRAKNAALLGLASLAILGLARAQDDKKEKDVQESALESSDARGPADKLQEKLGDESWKEAWAAANE